MATYFQVCVLVSDTDKIDEETGLLDGNVCEEEFATTAMEVNEENIQATVNEISLRLLTPKNEIKNG